MNLLFTVKFLSILVIFLKHFVRCGYGSLIFNEILNFGTKIFWICSLGKNIRLKGTGAPYLQSRLTYNSLFWSYKRSDRPRVVNNVFNTYSAHTLTLLNPWIWSYGPPIHYICKQDSLPLTLRDITDHVVPPPPSRSF